MDLLNKNISYLKGLAEGYGLDGDKDKVHHLILQILDCLDLMAEEIKFLDGDFQRLEEYCEMMDEDLAEIENIFDDDLDYDSEFDDEDWDDWDFDDDDEEDEVDEEDEF